MLARLLVPALALAVTAADAAQRSCTRSAPPNAYLTGELLSPEVRNVTVDECESRCAENSSCAAYTSELDWTLDRQGFEPICVLFSIISIREDPFAPDPSRTVGRCGAQLPAVNGDFPGNDLSNAPAVDAVQCSYTCEKTKDCVAYSWTNYNNGTCWMKKAAPSAATAPFDGSVTSGTVFKCSSLGKDTDYEGGDFTSVPRADWRDCCGVCLSTPGCTASTWSDYNGGTCWLKKNIVNSRVKTVKGVRAMLPFR